MDEETLKKQNIGRRICTNCEKDYNIFYYPIQRLIEYKNKTLSLIDCFKNMKILFEIDENKLKIEIHKKIINIINEFL